MSRDFLGKIRDSTSGAERNGRRRIQNWINQLCASRLQKTFYLPEILYRNFHLSPKDCVEIVEAIFSFNFFSLWMGEKNLAEILIVDPNIKKRVR